MSGARSSTPRADPGGSTGPVFCDWPVWGTTVRIGVLHAGDLAPARTLVEREIAAVDAACNRFHPWSDLSRCNDAAGRFVAVDAPFLDALGVALEAAAATGGAVDPTVGAALVALGYDRDFDELAARPPVPLSAASLSASTGCAVVGWQRVEVDRRRGRVRIPAGAALDLGATAKALCVDRAVRAVARTGIGVMVDIGGDLAVDGPLPAGGGWRIAVQESSRAAADPSAPVVAVSAGAVATSGTTMRSWTVAGCRVHHIIDPATGQPVDATWRMVSVAAPTCVEANMAATSALVRGGTACEELARQGRPARLVDHDGRVVVVGGWPADPSGPPDGARPGEQPSARIPTVRQGSGDN